MRHGDEIVEWALHRRDAVVSHRHVVRAARHSWVDKDGRNIWTGEERIIGDEPIRLVPTRAHDCDPALIASVLHAASLTKNIVDQLDPVAGLGVSKDHDAANGDASESAGESVRGSVMLARESATESAGVGSWVGDVG